jgi:Putative Flp pilus-assembly TadE/G-like
MLSSSAGSTTQKLHRFRSDSEGAVTIISGLMIVVILAVAGSAIDYGRANWLKTQVQSALDSAVLAGVSGQHSAEAYSGVVGGVTNEEKVEIAKKYFEANRENIPGLQMPAFSFDGDNLVGETVLKVDNTLLRLLGFAKFDVGIRSAATSAMTREPLCIMAMHPTRKHTLEMKQQVKIFAPDCNIYGNSDHIDDVVDPHTPENHITGRSVQAVGYGHHFIANVTPPLEHAPELIPDPLAALPIPAAGVCTFTNIVLSGGVHTLTPGSYCGGLEIKGGAVATFAPGLYVISDGKFIVEDSEINGDEVTIALADDKVEIDWSKATIRLSAPKSGQYRSMVLIGTREPTDHTISKSTVDFHGVIYLLNGAFEWENEGTPDIQAKWSAWVVDGFSWDGNGTLNFNFKIEESDVPFPPELNVIPRPGGPRLVL